MTDAPAPIFIVEDERKLARLLADYLSAAGFATRAFADGREVVPAVREQAPQLILLDLMLPGQDGLAVCQQLRVFTAVPIIMMTARIEEIDRLLGLELGADDYVCKPYSPREIVARVKAVLRRTERADRAPASGLVIDDDHHAAMLYGHALDLTPVEFRLLKAIAATPGRIVRREALLAQIYTDHRVVTDRTLDSHAKNLRRKLAQVTDGRDLVRSIYGVGYKLEL